MKARLADFGGTVMPGSPADCQPQPHQEPHERSARAGRAGASHETSPLSDTGASPGCTEDGSQSEHNLARSFLRRKSGEGVIYENRNAALLVASDQAAWRKENGRQRVPSAETDGMIDRAIAEAAKAFGVPAASIKRDNIRIALKAGRI